MSELWSDADIKALSAHDAGGNYTMQVLDVKAMRDEYEARIAELEARLTQTWHPDWSNYPSWVNYVVSYPGGAFVKFLECAPTADGERTDGRWCWQRIEHEYTPTVFKKPE